MRVDTYQLSLPAIFQVDFLPLAEALLRDYFALQNPQSGRIHSGAHFETLTGRWDDPGRAYQITAGDLVAVSCLGVNVPGDAAVQILEEKAAEISAHLRGMPEPAQALWEVHASEIGEASRAWQLWELLMKIRGIGATTASKIMARKRANLVPVFDEVIGGLFGPGDLNHWELMSQLMVTPIDQVPLHQHLAQAAARVGLDTCVTPLRVFDVIAWYAYNQTERKWARRLESRLLNDKQMKAAFFEPIEQD